MSTQPTSSATPATAKHLGQSRAWQVVAYGLLLLSLWNTLFDGRVPAALSPTVARTLYFKLPIAGTRFHWTFLDRRAFLSGELTLRILNTRDKRDTTLVIFRDGTISDGWAMIGDMPRDSSVYFGFESQERFPTTVGDSIVITLVAREGLRGRGPHSEGTLAKGRWVATGTYALLAGGTLNPIRDLVHAGQTGIAFLECWDTVWRLEDARDVGWMGEKPAEDREIDSGTRQRGRRGVDGRRCRSTP